MELFGKVATGVELSCLTAKLQLQVGIGLSTTLSILKTLYWFDLE